MRRPASSPVSSAFLLGSLLLLSTSAPAAASPPATPATFASSTLMAMHIALGPAADGSKTTHAARMGTLLDLGPDVCRPSCDEWAGIETTCVRMKVVENCNEPFCTSDMMDSFVGCLNCLLYNGAEDSIPESRYGHLMAQITTLQNGCTQYAGLVSPTVRIASYDAIGANSTGAMDNVVRSYATSAGSSSGAGARLAGSSRSTRSWSAAAGLALAAAAGGLLAA